MKQVVVFADNYQGAVMTKFLREHWDGAEDHEIQHVPFWRDGAEPRHSDQVDLIIAQVGHSINAEHRLVKLLRRLPETIRLMRIPVVSCPVLWPFTLQIAAPWREPGFAKPRFPWGDRCMLDLIRGGVPAEAAVEQYLALDVPAATTIDRIFDRWVERTRQVEAGSDVGILDFLLGVMFRRRTFVFHDDVERFVLQELLNRVLGRLKLPRIRASADQLPKRGLKQEMPIHPSILNHFGVEYIKPDHRYAMDWGEPLTFREWARAYADHLVAERDAAAAAVASGGSQAVVADRIIAQDSRASDSRSAEPPKSCEIVLFYGQSNAGGGGVEPSIFTEALGQDRALTFATRRQLYGAEAAGPTLLSGVTPVADNPNGPPLQATPTSFAMAQRLRDSAAAHLHYFYFTVWFGSQPLSTFARDTPTWRNLMTGVRASRAALERAGFDSVIRALFFIQGENGPSGRAAYRHELELFLDDLLPAVQREAGQANLPIAIVLQTNKGARSTSAATHVELAQWDVVRRREDAVLAGPSYQAPLIDNSHQSLIGRMILGELLALVYELRVRRGIDFKPLHPAAMTHVGRHIRLTMSLPPQGEALQWDTDWVEAGENYGFVYTDDGLSTSIASVEIVAATEILITLTDEPHGKARKLTYAQGQTNVAGWASGRGQLISPTAQTSYFHALGHPVPARINHYCIRFALDLDDEAPDFSSPPPR